MVKLPLETLCNDRISLVSKVTVLDVSFFGLGFGLGFLGERGEVALRFLLSVGCVRKTHVYLLNRHKTGAEGVESNPR